MWVGVVGHNSRIVFVGGGSLAFDEGGVVPPNTVVDGWVFRFYTTLEGESVMFPPQFVHISKVGVFEMEGGRVGFNLLSHTPTDLKTKDNNLLDLRCN